MGKMLVLQGGAGLLGDSLFEYPSQLSTQMDQYPKVQKTKTPFVPSLESLVNPWLRI
jgi:hypothetical protein